MCRQDMFSDTAQMYENMNMFEAKKQNMHLQISHIVPCIFLEYLKLRTRERKKQF